MMKNQITWKNVSRWSKDFENKISQKKKASNLKQWIEILSNIYVLLINSNKC